MSTQGQGDVVERLRAAAREIRNDGTASQVGLSEQECEDIADEITRLRALLSSSRGEQGWRTIDSAPKDGTKFLAWWDGKPIITYWAKRDRFEGWQAPSMMTVNAGDKSAWSPTHWMPLPSAPGSVPTSAGQEVEAASVDRAKSRAEAEIQFTARERAMITKLEMIATGRTRCGPSTDLEIARNLATEALAIIGWPTVRPVPTSLAGQVPDGYVLVPKEPTEEMIEAGNQACDMNCHLGGFEQGHVYRAMLSAAPQPTAGGDAPIFDTPKSEPNLEPSNVFADDGCAD